MKVINIDVTDKLKITGVTNGEVILNSSIPIEVASGNYKSIILNFSFKSKTWTEKELVKYATFTINDYKEIQTELITIEEYENACYIPYDVIKRNCKVNVGVYGISNSGGDVEKIVSSETIRLFVIDGSYSEDLRESTDIEPTESDKLEQKILKEVTLLINNKVEKEDGKGLSTNDFTTDYMNQIKSNTANRHSHTNKTILDNTTASFTEEDKTKLDTLPEINDIVVKDSIKSFFKNVTYNSSNGILTFEKNDDSNVEIDLPLELIVKSGKYDSKTKNLVLTLANEDVINIPVSELINEYFADNETIELNTVDGKETFNVKDGVFVKQVSGKGLSTNDFTTDYMNQVKSNTTNRHTHTNKTILDNTTASFTEEDKKVLDSISNLTACTNEEIEEILNS